MVNDLNADTTVEVTNEFEIFGKSVGLQLNAMSLENALRTQSIIQNYISKIRLQELTRMREHSSLSDCSISPRYSPQQHMPSPTTFNNSYEYMASPEVPSNSGQSQSDYFLSSSPAETPVSNIVMTYTPNTTPNIAHDTGTNLYQQTEAQRSTYANNSQSNDILSQALANIPM